MAVKQWRLFEGQIDRDMSAQGFTVDLTKDINIGQNSRFCCDGPKSDTIKNLFYSNDSNRS